MKKFSACIILVFMLMILSGCGMTAQKSDKISVVTTCFPPYDFARAVFGDDAEITMLLCPGAEAHSYEPAPLDIAKIQNCDVFVYVGGEGEVWADKILASTDTSDMEIIRLFDYINPLEEEDVAGASPDGHDEDSDEEEYDEHIWTTPQNAIKCVNGIAERAESRFSDKSEDFEKRSAEYISELEQLDSEFIEMRENSQSDTVIIADRFPFRYLAEEYNLDYYAAFSGCSSESEPGVYTMAFLINKIIEENTDTIFYLEFSTKKLAEKLCNATGAMMLPLNSCHNVTPDDFKNGVTYIDLMRQNLNNLREALE